MIAYIPGVSSTGASLSGLEQEDNPKAAITNKIAGRDRRYADTIVLLTTIRVYYAVEAKTPLKSLVLGGVIMLVGRVTWLAIAGVAATIWAAANAVGYLQQGGPLGAGSEELPMTISGFFTVASVAGVVGGLGLSLGRRWAASLLWLSWLGVLIDGSWAPSVYGGRLQPALINLLAGIAFAMVAQWGTRRHPSRAAEPARRA